jgi:succinyl-CoA synthetase (ADP-forming) alpha subunit (EC 6.2.1.5)
MTDIFELLKGKPEDSDYEKKGVIVQGITGSYGSIHAKQMRSYGTNVVAGVTPGKGGQKFEETIPIYNSMQEAVNATNAKISNCFCPSKILLISSKRCIKFRN